MSKPSVAPHFLAPLHSSVSFRCEGRKATVGGIDDQGRAFGFHDPVAAVEPELIVGNDATSRNIHAADLRVDQIPVQASILFPFESCRFLIGKEYFRCQRGGPLHWSNRS